MSLESVFAALAGAVWLGERLTAAAPAGCALILLGAVAAEAARRSRAEGRARLNATFRRDGRREDDGDRPCLGGSAA